MRKKILSIFLAISMILTFFSPMTAFAEDEVKTNENLDVNGAELADVSTLANAESGEPSKAGDVYQIATPEELSWFANHADATALATLTADIDIGKADFIPMFSTGFEGEFNGNQHKITYEVDAKANAKGLFHTIGKNGSVKNLSVAGNIEITARSKSYFGGIAYLNNGTISNSHSSVAIDSGTYTNVKYAGGIAAINAGIIDNCSNEGEIKVQSYAGGITGENRGGCIYNATNSADITALNASGYAGGIAACVTATANNDKMNITNGKNNGDIYGGAAYGAVGGIIGQENVATSYVSFDSKPKIILEKCMNTGTLTANATNDFIAKTSGNCEIEIKQPEKPKDLGIEEAKEMLAIEDGVVKEDKNIVLPSTYSATGVTITWESDNSSIIEIKSAGTGIYGEIHRPQKGETAKVILTATIAKNDDYDTKTFEFLVWSKEAVDEELNLSNSAYVNAAIKTLSDSWYKLRPESGKDTNVNVVLKEALSALGYSNLEVSLANIENPFDHTASIAGDGEITYFYDDPSNTSRLMWFSSIPLTFQITKEDITKEYKTNAVIYWDREKVEKYLQQEILDAIVLPKETSENLELPKYLGGKKGKPWVEISWQTSDAKVLSISNENQQTNADALYNPYVGRIFMSEENKPVTLTATVTFNRTNDMVGSEKPIQLVKTYEIIVKKMDDSAWLALKNKMQADLNYGYDLEKLTDFVTGEKLDLNAVVNDIQFLIPSKTGVNQYFNYKFSLGSSNGNVIEVPDVANAARGFVYRPLPGKQDERVTLTIYMTSRANPNLVVAKSFDVVVKALEQREIDDALKLMNLAKEKYFDGINQGKYADKYSVSGSLTSFQEAVFSEDKNDITWIYHHLEEKNNGIVADELDGWAEQEAWRTFRSSHPKIIDHETLNLLEKPDDDTFVRINSVLTHEVFGKYWSKFSKDSAYAVFADLYKQPVSSYILIGGKNTKVPTYESMGKEQRNSTLNSLLEKAQEKIDAPRTVSFTMRGLNGTLIPTTSFKVKAGATVFEVFRKALENEGYRYTANGSYVQSITDAAGTTLSEFSKGTHSGWMYQVNDSFPSTYMNAYTLEEGDNITVLYTTNYTKENSSMGGISPNIETNHYKTIERVISGVAAEGKNNGAKFGVSDSQIKDAIKEGVEAAKKSSVLPKVEVTVAVSVPKGASSLETSMKASALKLVSDAQDTQLTIRCELGSVTFDNKILKDMIQDVKDSSDVVFSIQKVDANKLSEDVKKQVGENSVVDLSLYIDGIGVHQFQGEIKAFIPYSLPAEKGDAPFTVYYIDNQGNLEEMKDVIYNQEKGGFSFTTKHLSMYYISPIKQEAPIKAEKRTMEFTDVTTKDWFYEPVKEVFDRGLVSGVEDTVFAPQNPTSRAMFITILYRYAGEPSVNNTIHGFKDVKKDDWYADAISWGAENGIVNGYSDGYFGVNDNITREQAAQILLSYGKAKGMDITSKSELSNYTDKDMISDWAMDAMEWANAKDIITGRTQVKLAPAETTTRAEIASMFMRFIAETEK